MLDEISYWKQLLSHWRNSLDVLELVSLLLLPGILLSVSIAILIAGIYLLRAGSDRREISRLFGISAVLSFVAFIVGFVSANTRETIVGDIVPVLISGFGLLLVYTYVKQEVQTFAAGAAAVAFSISLFTGMVAGGQNRDGFGGQSLKGPLFGNLAQVQDEIGQHRADVVASSATLEMIRVLIAEHKLDEETVSALETVELYVVPRKNFHIAAAFTSEEMDQYHNFSQENPNLDITTIDSNSTGSERTLLKEIHFALNPLEGVFK